MASFSARLRELVARGRGVVALTGAGMSAESGVPTFRGQSGFWEDGSVEDLATAAGFARDPRRVWDWYDARRIQISRCAPNAGHLALARYGEMHPEMRLVTQNVDGLHAAAGSGRVIALHGDLFRVRCTRDGLSREDRRGPRPPIPPRPRWGGPLPPPVRGCGALLPAGAVRGGPAAARAAELLLCMQAS